ncbi:MAG: TolC family protein [Bryobacteraceae bacterium]
MRSFVSELVLCSCAVLLPATMRAQQPPIPYVDSVTGTPVEKLVDLALSRNADLMAARQRTAEAQGLLLQSELRPNPTLEASVANGAVLKSPGEREYTLGYSHTFELGGKRERRVAVGRLGVDLVQLLIADRERQLKADVKTRFGEALAAVRNLESARRTLDLNQQSLRIAAARTKQGESASLEQALIQVEVNRMRADCLLFANQVERTLLELKTLTGMRPDEQLQLSGNLAGPANGAQLADVLTRALASRPDLQAARLEENMGEAEVQLAKTEVVPNLVATGRYSRSSSRFDQFGLIGANGPLAPLRDTDNVLAAGVSITLPVRNRNQGNIQAAVARQQAARLRVRALEQSVCGEVEAAHSRYETARQALTLFNDGVVKQSEDNVRVLMSAYNQGELPLLNVINEQRRLVDTQKAYSELLRESYLAAVDLERAVGTPLF